MKYIKSFRIYTNIFAIRRNYNNNITTVNHLGYIISIECMTYIYKNFDIKVSRYLTRDNWKQPSFFIFSWHSPSYSVIKIAQQYKMYCSSWFLDGRSKVILRWSLKSFPWYLIWIRKLSKVCHWSLLENLIRCQENC